MHHVTFDAIADVVRVRLANLTSQGVRADLGLQQLSCAISPVGHNAEVVTISVRVRNSHKL
eukprot:7381995-Karenia_brevis.AAC.1